MHQRHSSCYVSWAEAVWPSYSKLDPSQDIGIFLDNLRGWVDLDWKSQSDASDDGLISGSEGDLRGIDLVGAMKVRYQNSHGDT